MVDLRVGPQAHLVERAVIAVEPVRAHRGERRRQRREGVARGAGPGELLVVQHDAAVCPPDRDEAAVEAALGGRLGSPFLAGDRQLVALLAGETLDAGDQVAGDALGHGLEPLAQRRVEAVEGGRRPLVDRPPRHGLHAAADHHVLHAGEHAHRRQGHGSLPRPAEAVEGEAGRLVRPAGGEHGEAADAVAVVADAVAVADDDILDHLGADAGALGQRVQTLCQQFLRVDAVQGAGGLALAPRRADAVDDPGLAGGAHQ